MARLSPSAARLDAQTVLDTIARQVADQLGDVCIIRLISADSRRLDLAALHDPDPDLEQATRDLILAHPYTLDEGLNGQVARTSVPVVIPVTTPDEIGALTKPAYRPHLRLRPLRSLAIVPIRGHGRVIGTLAVSRISPDLPYTEDDVALLEDLADRAGMALENAQLFAEARAAEARYRALFESAGDAIFVADGDGRYIDVNPAAVTLLGRSRDELLTMRVADIVPDGPRWVDAEYEASTRAGHWHGELNLRRADGTLVPVEARATIATLPSGPVYLSVARDISERRAAERLQREFMTIVTHDLKSPLTSIKGDAQLMRRRG